MRLLLDLFSEPPVLAPDALPHGLAVLLAAAVVLLARVRFEGFLAGEAISHSIQAECKRESIFRPRRGRPPVRTWGAAQTSIIISIIAMRPPSVEPQRAEGSWGPSPCMSPCLLLRRLRKSEPHCDLPVQRWILGLFLHLTQFGT